MEIKMKVENESTVTSRGRCPSCAAKGMDRSSDNLAIYDDGHSYCYSCGYYKSGEGETTMVKPDKKSIEFTKYVGECIGNLKRGISKETAKKYNYQCNIDEKLEIANYYKNGTLVAQHLRGANKKFFWNGNNSSPTLWGQHLWRQGGKRIVITEGEYDCMAINQMLGGRWGVVSLPSGAMSAVKSIKDNLEWVASYDEIILAFDQDEPGREAMTKVAELLPPGKCKIACLPCKDGNECLIKGMSTEAVAAIWEAQPYAPDEILHISKVIDSQDLSDTRVYPFPFDALTEFLIGQRSGEITLWASGTGSGKTTILRELMHHHLEEERSVGAIMLEESPKETMDDMISLMINKPVRAIRAARLMNDLKEKMGKEPVFMDIIDDLTDEEYADARIKLGQTAFYVYDHLGNNGLKNLCARMEYMAVSLNVDVIVLDHITAAAAGLMGTSSDFDGGSSERLLIDNIMKELRALVSRTGVRIDVVSQLKKTNKAYEEGDRITLQDLRGSGSLASVPNVVVGLERDRQNEDDAIANTTTVRVLKNRLTGRAGVATALYFNRKSGRLEEVDFVLGDSGAEFKPV
jgi:twinkle protein